MKHNLQIEVVDQIDSTHSELLRRFHSGGLKMPFGLRARCQTDGRGRHGRRWEGEAEAGVENLFFSMAMEIHRSVRELPRLSLALGQGARDALLSLAPQLSIELKWPNDLLCENAKLGGLLCEIAHQAKDRCVIVAGIGINIALPRTKTLDQPRIDLRRLGVMLDAHLLAETIAEGWLDAIDRLQVDNWQSDSAAWRQSDYYFNRRIKLGELEGLGLGIADDGGYRIRLPSGEERVLYAQDQMRRLPYEAEEILLVDIGNTRLKWARADQLPQFSAIAHRAHAGSETDSWPKWKRSLGHLTAQLPDAIKAIVVCNVAGENANLLATLQSHTSARVALLRAAAAHDLRSPSGELLSWQSGYGRPERLGSDRVAAMLGARALWPGESVLVVGVGTALTADLIDIEGAHQGGLIGASPTLIRQSLHRNTAQLPETSSVDELGLASDTESAIACAALWQNVALIRELIERYRPARIVLCGGGSESLLPHLPGASKQPDLVLRGLAAWFAWVGH